ncbi:MAG: adenylate/guanylate cyclase domain-containing protein [Spirochaetales bacterium]|nr:adenylate/guanylate cyclase domain-containing protein [Spirochaetales bacterium]
MEEIIRAKFGQFKQTPLLEKVQSFLIEAQAEELFHIDIYSLAEQWEVSRQAILEVFFQSVRIGICDLQWEFHCPTCGGVARESLKLNQTQSEDYCPVCDVNFRNTLDDNIEVFFNISESVMAVPHEIKDAYMEQVKHSIAHENSFQWKSDRTVTGMDCLGSPVFREIFGDETLPADHSLAIRFSTILFTDIKGSTAMYERLGDAKAFKLVRDHFDILFSKIREFRGIPIKTIGDAVMGVFHSEVDALNASFEIQKALRLFYEEQDEKIEVKIGLHSGPAIVVTLNDVLDYFGSTVNRAARIQGLSRPNEVVFTEEIFDRNRQLLSRYVSKLKRSRHNLKGLSETFTVFHADCNGAGCKF